MTNAADVLIAILHARDKGESPALILAYDSPLMDAARDVLRPQAPYVDSEIATLQARIAELEAENARMREVLEKGDASDGYHTHNELYEFRKLYNAALFNTWESSGDYSVHKSLRHHDGSLCFGGGWFIVVAMLPTGQISNHYKIEDWNLFQITEADSAWFEYDGHTGTDVINRLEALLGGGE